MNFFRSFRTLLVSAILIINVCVLPFVVTQVMSYVEEGYATQFVDNARTTASLISAQLSILDIKKDEVLLRQYLDDLIDLGHLSFAQLIPDASDKIIPLKSLKSMINFSEDVSFGQHNDNMYFIAGPFFDSDEKLLGLYHFGFDESVTEFRMKNAMDNILYYAFFFFILTSVVFIFVAQKFTQPIAKLRDAANQIAAGNTAVTLNNKSNIAEMMSLTDSLENMRAQLIRDQKEISSHEVYEAEIMNNMADALIVIDKNWCVFDMNWEAQKLFKIVREEAVGNDFSDLFSKDLMLDIKQEIEGSNAKSFYFEWAGCKRRGICLYLELKLSLVKLKSDIYVVCSARDMTVRKQIEDELISAKKKSDEASKAKSTFLYTMSHELRTPLNAIIGYSDLLIEDAAEINKPHFVHDLNSIQTSATHLLNLINTVLDISKIEAGKMDVEISAFTVQNLLDEILVTLIPAIEGKNNTIDIDKKLRNIEIQTDFFKLKQIFINLIDNAAKFTTKGTIRIHLNKTTADYIEIAVSDTGIGISENDLPKLFDSFSQVDPSSTRNFDGTGLGLSIGRKLSQLLGGDIRVESELGKGTTFIVQLSTKLHLANQKLM